MRVPFRLRAAHILIVALATIGSARAGEIFTVTTSFTGDDTFALGELSAYIEACANNGSFDSLSVKLQDQCVKKLISPTAACNSVGSDVVCDIDGVLLQSTDMSFSCGDSGCPFADGGLTLPDASACAVSAVEGYTGASNCYSSAYCLFKSDASIAHFGDFCPATTGEYCCSPTAALDNGALPTGVTAIPNGASAGDYVREIDHLVDMSFKVYYDVEAPAKLKVTVEVPYVTSTTQYTHVEDGATMTYDSCPTTYLVDFQSPIETRPAGGRTPWLPLTYFPYTDQVGQPRGPCSNADFGTVSSETDFLSKFNFYDVDDTKLTYGKVPAVDATVWDPAAYGGSTDGIPNGANTFWKMHDPVGARVNYTTEAANGDFYDLVKTFSKCENYADNSRVVSKTSEEPMFINGVPYPVETYSWEMTVCQAGLFGRTCRDPNTVQNYAKTCRTLPASFSISPQQISHAAAVDAPSDLVSKTFLQAVTSTPGGCSSATEERVVVTINLVMMTVGYTITEDTVHDLLEPLDILDGSQTDIGMTKVNAYETTADFIASDPDVGEGVYFLKRIDNTVGSVTVYSHKVVIVTKCYNTGFNSQTRKRAFPKVFAEDVADNGFVRFDLEVVTSRNGGDIKNTLNLRVLATEETFVLPSAEELEMEDISAAQYLYGAYETARDDRDVNGYLGVDGSSIELFGDDQVCSKHQITGYDASVALMTPNLVGACLLSQAGTGNARKGTTIKYKLPGMVDPADYTFGCIEDWIDLSTATETGGVFVFPAGTTSVPRLAGTHENVQWFVLKEKLNEAALPNGDTVSDRFGTGLMYFNSTDGASRVFVSDEMQIDSNTRLAKANDLASMTPGCNNAGGNLKGACNLVCFDLVDGILTNVQGTRAVLVHHESVAEIATEAQSTGDKKFSSNKKHRRMLLESVSAVVNDFGRAASVDASASSAVVVSEAPGAKTGLREITVSSRSSSGYTASGPEKESTSETITWIMVSCTIVLGVVMLGCYVYTVFGGNRPKYAGRSETNGSWSAKLP